MLAGDVTGNHQPVTQTNNNIIKRVTFTQCGLKIGPRDNSNETLKCEVCSEARSYRPKDVEGGKFDDDTHSDNCLLGKGLQLINTHVYECNVSGL